MRPRSASGQAAVEYLAVVAVVAVVLVGVGGFVLDGRAVAAATVAQIRRGLCVVQGHDCAVAHPPCSLSSRSSAQDWSVDVAVVHLGAGRSAIVEHRSDGRILVTLADHVDLGATGGFGAELTVGDRIAIGGEVRAAALASLARGASYEVPDDRTADELIATLRRERTDPGFWRALQALASRVSPPVARFRELGLTGTASLGPLAGRVAAGGREDLVTGARTVYLKGGASLGAGGPGGGADAKLAVTLDRHGRPVDLMVLGAGRLEASADLPAALQPLAGHLAAGRGRAWELEAHLDLTEPGRAHAVLGSLADPPRLVGMVLKDGTIQARAYATSETALGLGAHAKAGLAIGAEVSSTAASRRLVAAMEHTREGFWVPRLDCLAAA
jgi:hypothetical protein